MSDNRGAARAPGSLHYYRTPLGWDDPDTLRSDRSGFACSEPRDSNRNLSSMVCLGAVGLGPMVS